MARPPKPRYWRSGYYTDFGFRNRLLVSGPEDAATKLLAEKELIKLREEARLLTEHRAADTPLAIVVEAFLDTYVGRPAYQDFSNELHWFMGESRVHDENERPPATKRGKNWLPGGRFGFPCKQWPLRRINAELVERYLRRRRKAGLAGYHAFVTLRTLLN